MARDSHMRERIFETGVFTQVKKLKYMAHNLPSIKILKFETFWSPSTSHTTNYSTRKPTATFRHRRSRPRHLASSTSWQKSVHPNVLSLRPRRSPPGAPQNSTKNCHANSFQNKCENNFARKARSVEVLNQPSNRKRDSITNHPPPSPNP